ncbi:TIGR02678 family protein [Streptoalloteichus tenebrarius]|uniref:TIGR02678 family protein n=1 Tax=Streptoalloteichus tenebrarius (strain ATCC 17920 / DSM 40477 / JCM 4838 / CBS 697.72 / NBRC 16177 / NCIMB 11028 / NRRL B-12390 / A12253. 1 / ISP 5477) TaxID=1933 RepID=A0ABT1HNN7_STRSD|nr:TIGR02678 family protein [Streptoalloteichus tenebrarius]MCP2257125.1 TIGR02678 family protein [Streptoalloteichus tenebrarius]BFE98757.1 hypothetical protein GCM10020241_04330 [Streptoalloteichus tenebrarius]
MNRDAAERQRAFTALLRSPVLDRRTHPDVWPLVRVHRVALGEWFTQRLGYRLVVTDSAARLFRLPVDGVVVAPRRFRPPTRRVLVLAILAAAAAEDAEDITTTQDLSDRVRVLSTHEDVGLAPYDPDRYAERTLFVKAVRLLVSMGALRPIGRDDEERREGWAHHRDAIGGAYEVRRELLLRLVDPASLRVALSGGRDDGPPHEAAARIGLMRKLVELPVVLYEDLTDAERHYLTSQRHRVLTWCAEMTGWVVEQRAEGMALIAADEADTDLPFPRQRAADFAALMVLDELVRTHGAGSVVTADDLRAAASEVRARHAKAMTNELRVGNAVESTARDRLGALDLLRPTGIPDTWRLTAAAARFRDPRVVAVNAKLDEEDEG